MRRTFELMGPLRFEPIFRRYLWGDRRLATVLDKRIGPENDYAESWEVVDHGADQSRVIAGPLAGKTLHELVEHHGADLLGRHHPQSRFPLLYKFIDAQQTLSVQVHPDDARAAKLTPPDAGKTEAWIVLDAPAGSVIYAGLKRGFDRAALEREVARGTVELCLHKIEPRTGDCIFIPAGVVHAIGAGLLVAEIQQSSDTTWRLFDWNRRGPDGQPRTLHVAQALEAIDFNHDPVEPQIPQPTESVYASCLISSEKFVLDRWRFDTPQTAGGDDRCHIISVLDGAVSIAGDPLNEPLPLGGTILLPASAGPTLLTPRGPAVLLDMYLP